MKILNSPIMDNPKVYLWGAKNLHKASKHPAYKYKGYLEALADVASNPKWFDKLKELMKEKSAADVIIYGENELSSTLFRLFKTNGVNVRYILARDFVKCNCETDTENMKKVSLNDYESSKNDFIIISNFEVRNLIERDLYFNNYNGNLFDIAELNNRFK